MKKRLRIILTVLTLLAMVCVLAICFVWMSQFRVQDLRRDLSNVMNTASYLTNVGDTSDYDAYAKRLARDLHGDIRVTIVAADGKVLGDSYADYSAMANHLDRPEMIEAIRDGYGEDVRKSETTGEDNFYAAMILTDGIYIRVSAPVAVAYSFILQVLPPVLLLCVAVFLVILFLSRRVSARFTRPFEELSGAVEGLIIDGKPGEISAPPYDELVPVVRNIRDLSGRLQMYIAEIKQKSAEIEDIISATDDGVVVLDGSMHIITINERAKELFGGAGDAKSFEMVCRDIALLEKIKKTFRSGKESHAELDMRNKNGRVYRCIVSPAKSKEGLTTGAVLFLSDVTEIIRLERVRSDFAANVSHELKTPLTAIKGFSELMDAGLVADEEKKREYIRLIMKESDRLMGLINDILKLAELENATEDPQRLEIVSIGNIVKEVQVVLEGKARERQVTLSACGDGSIRADQERIREMVINLVDNAVKYNRPGGRVDVSVRQMDGKVILTVADTGIGIPLEHQERVFERFYRVDKGRSRKSGGTGLGLSIVRHTAEHYGGVVALESEEQVGTRITVTFPNA